MGTVVNHLRDVSVPERRSPARPAPPPEPADWQPSDHEIIERVRSGEVEAYALLVERHQARVHAQVQRMMGAGAPAGMLDEAADITQEVFVKVYQNLGRYRADASLQTWLHRVTANLCVDRYRRHRRTPPIVRSLDAPTEGETGPREWEPADRDAGPSDQLLTRELGAEVRRAVGSLREKLRLVVVLHDLQGLSYEEVALALRIPLGTVKSRLFHARLALREKLAAYVMDQDEHEADVARSLQVS